MSDLVAESTCWLAIKAREAAKSLPLVELDPGNSVEQLILVRYAFQNHPRKYHWQDIWKHTAGSVFQAMWADSVSDNTSIAADITSAYRPQWAELHVIRLGIPASFKLYKESDAPFRINETPQLTFESPTSAKRAKEFFVRLNIDPSNVAVIPFVQKKSPGATTMLVDPQPHIGVNQTESPLVMLPEFNSKNFEKPIPQSW